MFDLYDDIPAVGEVQDINADVTPLVKPRADKMKVEEPCKAHAATAQPEASESAPAAPQKPKRSLPSSTESWTARMAPVSMKLRSIKNALPLKRKAPTSLGSPNKMVKRDLDEVKESSGATSPFVTTTVVQRRKRDSGGGDATLRLDAVATPDDVVRPRILTATEEAPIEEEYDPWHPNEYELYCRDREAHRKAMREEEEARDGPRLERSQAERRDPWRERRDPWREREDPWRERKDGMREDRESGRDGSERRDRSFVADAGRIGALNPTTLLEMPAVRSRVLLLLNMVEARAVDDELEDEVEMECCKHGEVHQVAVHKASNGKVHIFVLFDSVTSAAKARDHLDERFFGGRTLRAVAYPEERFFDESYKRA